MIKFAGKCVAKFIPIPRDERRKEILRILNKIEKYAKRKEDYEKLSKRAKQRLEWIKKAKEWRNVRKVCRYYGISPATFYKWKKRYEIFGLVGLEDRDKTPKNKRQPEITREQEIRIIKLRKQYIRYGKEKLAVLYERIYGEKISSWKIYRVIRKYDLYWNPVKNEKLRRKRKLAEKKKRITELRGKEIKGFLFQLDTKVIWSYGTKRYLFNAIEKNTKFGFARMYKNCSSYSSRDFLLRLYYLVNKEDFLIQTDNGSEFSKYFQKACEELNITHYYSRVNTPKDNAQIERFNRTLEEEFLQLGNYIDDVESFNNLLGEWLIEYNFNRPHQSLGYLTPIEFLEEKKNLTKIKIYVIMNLMKMKKCLRSTQLIQKFDKIKNMCKIESTENKKVFTMYSTYTYFFQKF